MRMRFSVMIMIMLSLMLAGGIIIKSNRGDTMTKTSHAIKINNALPQIDKEVPAVTETATFALG